MTKTTKSLSRQLQLLTLAMDEYSPSLKDLVIKNFLRGMFFGIGTTVGAAIILAVISFSLSQLKGIPIFNIIITQSNIENILKPN